MDEQPRITRPSFRWLTNLAGGCLLVLFLMLGIAAVFSKPVQYIREKSATPTAIVTQVPHILVRQPADENEVLHEDFSSNEKEWSLVYPYGKLEVIQGKLILQSNIEQRYVMGKSQEFDALGKTYYAQADFTTDIDNAFGYGLAFGMSDSLATYYMFEVMPRTGYFHLLKFNTGKWEELVPFTQSHLKAFPEDNTLSVYFEDGKMELYINGNLVASVSDRDYFRATGVGVFANNNGYRLIVDNFFAYGNP